MASIILAFGGGDSQSIHFFEYQNGVRITEDFAIHYSKIAEHLENGNKYGLNNEQIQRICVYRQGAGNFIGYHAFIVIKTERCYFSIERWPQYALVHKSNVLQDVVGNCGVSKRSGNVVRETDWFDGKGTVWQVFNLILEKKILEKKFNILFRNCQVFASHVLKNFNDEGVKFRKYRTNVAGFPLRRAGGDWNLNRTLF